MEKTKEQLEQEIADTRKKLAELEELEKNSKRNNAVKKLSEFSVEDKVIMFNTIYHYALEQLAKKENCEYNSDNYDNKHYAWEEVMNILARNKNDFWKYWNSLK